MIFSYYLQFYKKSYGRWKPKIEPRLNDDTCMISNNVSELPGFGRLSRPASGFFAYYLIWRADSRTLDCQPGQICEVRWQLDGFGGCSLAAAKASSGLYGKQICINMEG